MIKNLLIILLFVSTTALIAQNNMNYGTIYIHHEKPSLNARIIQSIMGITGQKKRLSREIANNSFDQTVALPSKSLKKNFDVVESLQNERQIWTIKPKTNLSEKVILYLHGGAYVYNISKIHWDFIEVLSLKTNATIIIPDYPLVPEATFVEVYEFVFALYIELLENTTPENIIIMGDSAGGGLALGFSMFLRNEEKRQPQQIVLLSPWIDITMQNPDIKEIEKNDKILGVNYLQLAGQYYAGEADPKDYRVSPLYGDFFGLPKISIFIGTNDLLYPDNKKLKDILELQKVPINFFEYPKMFHVWMLIPNLEESKSAISQIVELILR